MIIEHHSWSVLGIYHPGRVRPFSGPADAVVCHHSFTPQQGGGVTGVRTVDKVTQQRGQFAMVPYSGLGPANGNVYLGRGDRYRNGANNNTRGGELSNRNTLAYCFVGDYRSDVVNGAQVDGFVEFCRYMVARGSLRPDFEIVRHRDVAFTECPAGVPVEQLRAAYAASLTQEGSSMQVLKTEETATDGWVSFGPRILYTTQIAGWEKTVGPSNTFVSRHAQAFIDKTVPAGIDANDVAAAVAASVAEAIADLELDVDADEIATATVAKFKEAL